MASNRFGLSALLLTLWLFQLVHSLFGDTPGLNDIVQCPANNISADLEIVPPIDRRTLIGQHTFAGNRVFLYCCATGFSHFNWYKNGIQLSSENDYHLYEYNNETTREVIRWYSLDSTDCTYNPPLYECPFTCEAISVDQQYSISHNITVFLFGGTVPPFMVSTLTTLPEFVTAEAEECLLPGDDLNIRCSLRFAEINPSSEIRVLFDNGTVLDESLIASLGQLIDRKHEGFLTDTSHYNVTVMNVTAYFMNQTYTCQSVTYPQVSKSFYVSQCQQDVVVTTKVTVPSKVSVQVAISLVAIILLVVVVVVLLVRFDVYANMWYKIHILQRFQSNNDNYKYDVYFIYKDVTHPVVLNSIGLLENAFNLTICLPDRDFVTGASTPESISECLKDSDKVVVFLSNDMLATEEKTHDWSDISLSLALALNKKMVVFLLEEVDITLVKNKRNIKAALKILDCISCPSGDKKILTQRFSKFFNMSA